jgi:hypothetical protein
MCTVGLSVDTKGTLILSLLSLIDLTCLCGGVYLLSRAGQI